MDWGHANLQIDSELMPLAHWRKPKWEVLRKDVIKFLKDRTDKFLHVTSIITTQNFGTPG